MSVLNELTTRLGSPELMRPSPLSGNLLKAGDSLFCLVLYQGWLLFPPFFLFFFSKLSFGFFLKSIPCGKYITIKLPWWDTTYCTLCQRGQLSVVNLLELGKICYLGRTIFFNALHWFLLFNSSKSFLEVGRVYTKI